MAETLEHLIERLQQEAVTEAEAKAQAIVDQARDKADAILAEARREREAMLHTAEEDAKAFEQRATENLHHAGRDLLISVRHGVESILSQLAAEAVDEAMTIEVLQQMLSGMAQSCAEQAGEYRLEFLLSPRDKEKLVTFFASRYREKMYSGLTLQVDKDIEQGFRVSFKEGEVYLDFTNAAVAEALSLYLRPRLAEIIKTVAQDEAS